MSSGLGSVVGVCSSTGFSSSGICAYFSRNCSCVKFSSPTSFWSSSSSPSSSSDDMLSLSASSFSLSSSSPDARSSSSSSSTILMSSLRSSNPSSSSSESCSESSPALRAWSFCSERLTASFNAALTLLCSSCSHSASLRRLTSLRTFSHVPNRVLATTRYRDIQVALCSASISSSDLG